MKRITRLFVVTMLAGLAGFASGEETAGVRLPDFERVELDNGLVLLLMEKHDVPLIAFHGRIDGGAVADPAGKAGSSEIVAELIQKGAGSRDALAFSQAIDSVGGTLGATSSREALSIFGEFMARDRSLMLELLSDMLTQPSLDEGEFAKIRDRSVQQIAAAKDSNPNALISAYFDALLFGDHPYGRNGDETSLGKLTHGDVRAWFDANVGADRTVLAFVGDFDAKELRKNVDKAFSSWRKAGGQVTKVKRTSPSKGRKVLLVDKPDATQTYFWLGNVGVARDDADRVALDLANTAFGGRFTSMLNTELRIKSGLSYGARSYLGRERTPGTFAITSYTKTESTEEAIDLAIQVLGDLHTKGLDDETLSSVQKYVAGQFPPRLETGDSLAERLTEIEFYGLDRSDVDDYGKTIGAVTADEIGSVIKRIYPTGDNLTFVLIGNADAVREVAKKYGDVTEMKITEKSFRPTS